MSVNIAQKGLPNLNVGHSTETKDAYGLPVDRKTGQNLSHSHTGNSKCSGIKAVFNNGVRVPILKDIESKFYGKGAPTSCRFDIVEKARTIVKPGARACNTHEINEGVKQEPSTMTTVEHRFVVPRQPTFHYTNQHHFDHKDRDSLGKTSPYHWSKYVKSAKEGDARDVLYKNTYCLDIDRLRYRSSTLPRIATDRPLSIESNDSRGKTLSTRSSGQNTSTNAKENTIIPQQPRGTVVRFREYIKPVTYSSNHELLEVKRVSSILQQPIVDHVAHVRHMLPLIRQDSRRATRVDRPLKFEHPRYREKGFKTTLYNKPVHHSSYEKTFVSADTFKEYLDNLQMSASKIPTKHGREGPDFAVPSRRQPRPYDVNAHALQSVGDVNKPDAGIPKAPPGTEDHSRTQDNRSAITIEIKSAWKQNERDTGSDLLKISSRKSEEKSPVLAADTEVVNAMADSAQKEDPEVQALDTVDGIISKPSSIIKIPSSRGSDSGTTCPTNTPTPNVDSDAE